MEQIDYAPLLPTRPPVDLVKWALEKEAFQKEYLIYKADRVYEPLEDRMRPAVKVICTSCGKTFYAKKISAGGCSASYAPAPFGWRHYVTGESVISGSTTQCPECNCKANVVHAGNIPRGIENCIWITIMSSLPVEGHKNRFVLTDWMVKRWIDKSGESKYTTHPYTAWVVEEKKVVRLMGYMKTIGGAISLFNHWEQRKTFNDVYGEIEICYPWDKSVLEGTTAENCKLDLYAKAGGKRFVSYLALWRRHPTVENLLVQGCVRLVNAWICAEAECYSYRGGIPKLSAINWKEKRPAQMLGLNKEEFRQFKAMRWSADDLHTYKMVREAGLAVKLPEDMKLLRSRKSYELNKILHETRRKDFWRVLRYLNRQGKDWSFLRDYWSMTKRLGGDLRENLVRWPRDLSAAHDRAMDMKKAKENAALHSLFIQRAEVLESLSFTSDGLLIRPCRTETELIREGKDLHHCVANYAKQHANGKTAILFIRKVQEPDKPFFTLEFDKKNKMVKQNRGLRNCARTPEVEAFEKVWLTWVKAERKKARKRIA